MSFKLEISNTRSTLKHLRKPLMRITQK